MSARGILSAVVFGSLCWLAIFWTLWLAGAFGHVKGCRTSACDHRIHLKRRLHWKHTHIWEYRWHHLTAHERSWAHCISFHESRNRRVARESAHWSYFQWALSTWYRAGGSGNPESHSWTEQAVRAVRWAHFAGSSQWSTYIYCGAV